MLFFFRGEGGGICEIFVLLFSLVLFMFVFFCFVFFLYSPSRLFSSPHGFRDKQYFWDESHPFFFFVVDVQMFSQKFFWLSEKESRVLGFIIAHFELNVLYPV